MAADDAFGTQMGFEAVGLYDMNKARGFNPQLAGNLRVEGLYIDVQGLFGFRLVKSIAMRIGLTAQSYPFPAPTGIADITMVKPGETTVTSLQFQYQDGFGFSNAIVDVTTPLIGDTLGFAGGFAKAQMRGDADTSNYAQTIAGSFRWRPSDNVEIIPFIYNNNTLNGESAPSVFINGTVLPPKFDRRTFYGEPWASKRSDEQNYGVIARGNLAQNWRLQAGVFHSQQKRFKNDVVFFRGTQPSGAATVDALRFPEAFSGSYSGEVRATGVFTSGAYRHTVHFGSRGRQTLRRFGGGQTVALGTGVVGVYNPHPEPAFTFGVRDEDLVTQITPGATYVGQWAGIGEFSVGLQRSFYQRDFGKIGAVPVTTKAKPWLYNGTLSLNAGSALVFYGGYTRGIEEFGLAPDNAANAGEPMRARVTKQIDGGMRYRIAPGLNLMAGVFEVSKPFFDRNAANVYGSVGTLKHRGFEASLSGKLIDNVTVVAGTMLLQPRVSGASVQAGLTGRIPFGTPLHLMRLSLQYDVPQLPGLALDTQLESLGAQYVDRLNVVRVPPTRTVTLGVRYNFKVGDVAASLRGQVFNVTDTYQWVVDSTSGRLTPTQPRRFLIRLAADI